VVPAVGGPDTLDVMAWNIENFPKSSRTVSTVADLVASLDVDVIAVEEVASVDAWNELVARLPEHDGVLSTHEYAPGEYQKIGFLYRSATVGAGAPALLFAGEGLPFPRPPLAVGFQFDDGVHAPLGFEAIGVHLKAGEQVADSDRRRAAVAELDRFLRAQIDGGGEGQVVVLGDFNEVLTDASGRSVLAPLLDAPDRYAVRTAAAAAAGGETFLGSGVMLDHVVTTAGLADEIGGTDARVVELDREMDDYEPDVSDHRPVVLSIPLAPR